MTLAGRCHAHNVGASLLAACSLSAGWVAASDDEYVQLAVDAASDIPVSRLRSCSLVLDTCCEPTAVSFVGLQLHLRVNVTGRC